jgi:hypothetical protein
MSEESGFDSRLRQGNSFFSLALRSALWPTMYIMDAGTKGFTAWGKTVRA